jgi:hypothetical protein
MGRAALGNTTESYMDGSYLSKTGNTWHLEDSWFKAKNIAAMLAQHLGTKLEHCLR